MSAEWCEDGGAKTSIATKQVAIEWCNIHTIQNIIDRKQIISSQANKLAMPLIS